MRPEEVLKYFKHTSRPEPIFVTYQMLRPGDVDWSGTYSGMLQNEFSICSDGKTIPADGAATLVARRLID